MTAFMNLAISSLDTPKSLIPFFVKDAFDVTGRTVMASNEGGKHEAREKFIEEAGTSLFWIGGIPAVRAIANRIVKGKIDTDIHFKRINTDGIQSYFAKDLTETKTVGGEKITKHKFSKEDLEGIVLSGEKLGGIKQKLSKKGFIPNVAGGTYKKYHVGVSAASVLINLVMLSTVLPMFNQFLSRKIISSEVEKNSKKQKNNQNELNFGNKNTFDKFVEKTQNKAKAHKTPSFGSLKELVDFKNLFNFTQMAENAQLNPTSSMLILDYGISGSRVTFVPRDNNERIEYAVKEGGIIMFFYYAADWIKKGLSALAKKAFKTPIDLDYRVMGDKEFLTTLKNPHKKEELLKFVEKDDSELQIIKFIDKELAKAQKTTDKNKVFKNFTLKMAQKEGLVDVEYDNELEKWIRHSKKFIETEKISDLNKNLKTFYEKCFEQGGENIEKTIAKTKTLKAVSVLGNIAICCGALSFVLPKIQYMIREHRTKTSAAPGIKVYQDMAEKNMI